MRRSLGGAATLLLLAVVAFPGCDSGVAEPKSQRVSRQDSDAESQEVKIPGESGSADLVELAIPERLGDPEDPAFEGWLDAGEIAPTLVAIHPEGRSALLTVGYLSVLYDLQSGQELTSWTERFSMASFSGDGKRLLTIGANTVVRDSDTGDEVCRIKRSGSPAITLSDDGSRLAITNDSFDRRFAHGVLIFDASTGRLHRAIPTPLATGFRSVAFVANGHRVLVEYEVWRHKGPRGQSPCHLPASAIWDTQTGELVRSFPDEATVCVSPDGRWIATGSAVKRDHREHRPADSDTTTLTLWDAATGEPVQELKHDSDLRDFAFSPDSERVLVSAGSRLVEWNWRSGERLHESDSEKAYARVYYSPDGRRRFALTEELSDVDDDLLYRLRGWTAETGAELPIADYEMSYNTIEDLFFFADCSRFVKFNHDWSGYAERDILSGEIVREPPKCRADATRCVFMPDGEKLLVDCGHGLPGSLLTDLESGRQRQWYLPGTSQAFVAGGSLLFTSSFKYLTLIDVVSNQIVWQYLLDERKTAAAMSPNGQHVVVATDYAYRDSKRSRLILLDTAKPSEIVVHNRSITALSFHPEGKRFVEATSGSVSECEPANGDRIRSLFEVPGRTLDLSYSLDGKRVLACGVVGHEDTKEPVTSQDKGWVALWDEATDETMHLDWHEAPVTCAALSPAGERCATGSLDKTVRLWDTTTGRLLHTFQGHLGEINGVAYSPKGDRILSTAEDGAAFWNVAAFAATPVEPSPLATGFQVVEKVRATYTFYPIPTKPQGLVLPIPPDYQPPPIPVRQAEDWTIIELGEPKRKSIEEDLRRWLSLAKSTKRYDGPLPVSEAARFGHRYALRGTTRDGDCRVYASSIEKKAILCDGAGEILRTWDAKISAESRVALLPSGEELVIVHETRLESGDYRYEIVIYDLETGAPKHKFVQDDGRELHGFYVFPTGSMFVLWMGGDRMLYDYQEGRVLSDLPPPKAVQISRSRFSPDGRFVATSRTAGADVILHDPLRLTPRKTLTNPFAVRWFKFGPEGKRLAVGQQSHLITMWDVDTARPLWTRRGTGNWSSTTATFSEDGRRFLKRGNEDVSVLWDAGVGDVLCVVRGPTDTVVLNPNGESLHLGTAEGPMIWPEMEEPLR